VIQSLSPGSDLGVDMFAQMMGGGDCDDSFTSSQGSDEGDDVDAIASHRVQIEITQFNQLRLPKTHTADDILELYSANSTRFPAHVLAMREAFSVRGTSADVEAIFSRSGNIMRARRSRLHADKLTMLMMIIANRSKMPKVRSVVCMIVSSNIVFLIWPSQPLCLWNCRHVCCTKCTKTCVQKNVLVRSVDFCFQRRDLISTA